MGNDPKISQKDLETWADILLNYSLNGIVPEDIVMVKGEAITWPLLSILQDKIFAAGAIADMYLVPPDNDRGKVWGASIARHGTIEQIQRAPKWYMDRYTGMTKYVEVMGSEHPEFFTNIPEKTASAYFKADEPYRKIRLQTKYWTLTLYPTRALAELEKMGFDEFTDFIVKASTTDPTYLKDVEEELYQIMAKSKIVRIQTEHPKTGKSLELRMNIQDRIIEKCAGEKNFPDGEVFTCPDANSVEGDIFVDLPIAYMGNTIQGIYLKFVNGVIKDYSAEIGFDSLRKIIETDAGSHRLGEIGLGMNNAINKVISHPLYVEKVGGTAHIAIGSGFPDCYVQDPASDAGRSQMEKFASTGAFNKSSQHIDIVTDFRSGGAGRAIYLDNTELFIKNNIWVMPK